MRRTRAVDWPEKLAEFIAHKSGEAFVWGTNDCALFAADCVKELTGVDPAAEFRGTYSTAKAALDLIEAQGGLATITTKVLGEPMEFALKMQRGDVALVNINGRESLTICVGSEVVGPAVEHGIALLPITEAIKAWEV